MCALHRHELDPDPTGQFRTWYDEAAAAGGGEDVNAMALATATAHGAPSVRMVLLRGFDEGDLCFYTGYESRKASELDQNPNAALLFHWHVLGRQVRIEGRVTRLPADRSDAYFESRPKDSRLGAWASHQGAVLESRAELERSLQAAEERFEGGEIPRPERWGGYRLTPERYEFWQHGDARLHDRFRYRREHGVWVIERLAP